MADSSLSDTFYGQCAQLYDLVAAAPGVRSWRERAADALTLSPGDTVVEMGCGTGANFPALRRRVGETGQVIGVDLVDAMLRQAQRRVDRAGWENVHVVRGDASQPPVTHADAVLSTFLVGMLDAPDAAVQTWADLCDGRVALLNAGRSDRLAGLALNPFLRLFVRLTAPGSQTRRDAPVRALERRYNRARGALFERTTDRRDERFGLGVLRLASGRVGE